MDTSSTEEMPEFEGATCDWADLPCHLSSLTDWLMDAGLFIPRKVYQALTEGLAEVIESIPVPGWMENAGDAVGNIPASVMWLVSYAALPQALAIFVSAYTLRFLIRRIPVIG